MNVNGDTSCHVRLSHSLPVIEKSQIVFSSTQTKRQINKKI